MCTLTRSVYSEYMQKIIRTIKLDNILMDLFLSFLLRKKYQVPTLSKDQESLISLVAERFLISGFILNSCDFNAKHISLVRQLKHQRKLQLMKQMTLANDLEIVAKSLNKKDINHVVLKGLALYSDGIYQVGLRTSRDIDLLVDESDIRETYDILRSLGFRYLN